MEKCKYFWKGRGCKLRCKPAECEGDESKCWYPELLKYSIPNKRRTTTRSINSSQAQKNDSSVKAGTKTRVRE